jgi:predicted MFS family arabinose efflux permease
VVLRTPVFLAGQAVSMLGDGLAVLAIPLLVLQVSHSPLAAVLASLPGSAGYLAAGLPAGVIVDRLSPWHVLIAGDILRAGIFAALFAVTGSAGISPWLILGLAFAAGVVTVFTDTALAIAVRDVYSGPRLIAANSWLESANQSGLIIGPGVAGLLAAAGLLHVCLLIDALTFLVSLCSLAAVRRSRSDQRSQNRVPASARALRRELGEGLRYLGATRLLLILLSFTLVLNLCLGADKLIIFLARNTLHLPAAEIGLVVAAGGIGGLLGALSTRLLVRAAGPVPAIVISCALSGAALIMIAAAPAASVLLIANLIYTWAIIAASVTMRALRQVLVPRELLGRVTSSWRLGGQGVTLVGGVLAASAAGLFGGDPRPVFAIAGSVTLLTVAGAWVAGLRRSGAAAASAALLGS